MTADEARDAILAVFKAAWDTTSVPANVVYSDKAGGEPFGASAWARVVLRHATGRQSSLSDAVGQRRWTSVGTLWVQVFAPVGDGMVTAYGLATVVLNAYRAAPPGAVWYRNPRLQETGSSGNFEQVNILVDFSYDDVR